MTLEDDLAAMTRDRDSWQGIAQDNVRLAEARAAVLAVVKQTAQAIKLTSQRFPYDEGMPLPKAVTLQMAALDQIIGLLSNQPVDIAPHDIIVQGKTLAAALAYIDANPNNFESAGQIKVFLRTSIESLRNKLGVIRG